MTSILGTMSRWTPSIFWLGSSRIIPKPMSQKANGSPKPRQPKGDLDCKLGCKKKRNKPPAEDGDHAAAPQTSPKQSYPATNFSAHDVYYWGYASGVVATKIDGWLEAVLADLTQTFEADDTTYFHPLMAQTETHLGFAPTNGAFDAAWDAWYVYDYFAKNGGIAAVPFSGKGGDIRLFSDEQLAAVPS